MKTKLILILLIFTLILTACTTAATWSPSGHARSRPTQPAIVAPSGQQAPGVISSPRQRMPRRPIQTLQPTVDEFPYPIGTDEPYYP